MASNKKMSLKLLVDKTQSRVVLAESDRDFVDILLSFLTMPIGTIIRLLGKDSSAGLGCFANLYESVESLDVQHFQTEACKDMLLRPLNAAGCHCEDLVVNIDDTEPRTFFSCPESGCCSKATCFYSSVPNVRCSCGRQMSRRAKWEKTAAGDGVFIKGGCKFIVSDRLRITMASTTSTLSIFHKLGIKDAIMLEERILDLGREEVLKLLLRTLSSNTPLTDLCFNTSEARSSTFQPVPKSETNGDSECEEMKVKLLVAKSNSKVVYMECGQEVVDLLFGFLVVPLGCLIELLDKNSAMGCADDLYSSVEGLCSDGNDWDCIKSEKCKMMLLSPKLAPHFGIKTQLLKIEESISNGHTIKGYCYTCYRCNTSCWHSANVAIFQELNPKSPNSTHEPGGGYAKGPCKFMVTDNLHVAPLSPLSTVRTVNELGVRISDLVEREVSIRETQALNLLKAAAVASETALTDVFCPSKKTRRVAY